jgi:hypothetical protein
MFIDFKGKVGLESRAACAASTASVAALVTVGVGVSLIRVGIFK